MPFSRRDKSRALGFESLQARLLLAADSLSATLAAEGEGETHFVQQRGSLVFVLGTAADNEIEFQLGSNEHRIRVDGMDYTFNTAEVSEILLAGNNGDDEISVLGSDANDRATIRGGNVKLTSGNGIVRIESFERIRLDAGMGDDRAQIIDTAGDDVLIMRPDGAVLSTDAAEITILGFEQVEANAVNGGMDRVEFHDSANDDRFTAGNGMSSMIGSGYRNMATGFDVVQAFYELGGNDEVQLADSDGDDHLVTRPNGVVLDVGDVVYEVHDFPMYRVTASAGNDTAEMHGSLSTTSSFMGQANSSSMRSIGDRIAGHPNSLWPGSTSQAVSSSHITGFDRIEAFAVRGGGRAELMGSAGVDRYVAFPELAELRIEGGATIEVNNFQVVRTFGNGGADRATLLDSPRDDRFVGRPTYSYLRDAEINYFNFVAGFTVDVVSTSGADFGEVAEWGAGAARGKEFVVLDGPDFFSYRLGGKGERMIGFARGSSLGNGRNTDDDAGLLILQPLSLPDGFCLCGDHDNSIFPSQEVSDAIVQRSDEAVGVYEIQDGTIVLINSDETNFGGA